MQRDVEGEAGVRPAKKPWKENEVGSTGNREKFGQALYCAKDNCLKDVHRLTCTLGTLYQSFEKRGPIIPFLVRRGGCGIKKISAKPTLMPQTGWSLTPHDSV